MDVSLNMKSLGPGCVTAKMMEQTFCRSREAGYWGPSGELGNRHMNDCCVRHGVKCLRDSYARREQRAWPELVVAQRSLPRGLNGQNPPATGHTGQSQLEPHICECKACVTLLFSLLNLCPETREAPQQEACASSKEAPLAKTREPAAAVETQVAKYSAFFKKGLNLSPSHTHNSYVVLGK